MSETITEIAEPIRTVDHKPHAAFFRQSGWLVVAAIVGGAMTWLVHFLSKSIPEAQYATFVTLLMATACLPTMPLQMIFAQQGALALATGRERQLAGMIRLVALWTFILWVAGALAIFLFRGAIVRRWQLPGAGGLLVTMPLFLVSLWFPLFSGVVQGRQDFFWLGWATIIGGAGRFIAAAILVLAVALGAAGMMAGALIGVGMSMAIVIWRSRDLWSLRAEPFDTRGLLRQVLPMMFGFGACQFMFTSDTIFAKVYFPGDEMAPYVAAGTLSRALLWLVLPLATVMFPKIVHAHARSEKSNLFGLVVLGTAVLAAGGALGLWLVGPLMIKLVYPPEYLSATLAILPWYAGAMVPLALANVLVNDLLARARFGVVPWMVLLAVAYGLALPAMLNHFPGRMTVALQVLGTFNLLLFLLCAWFVWGSKGKTRMEDGAPINREQG